MEPAPDVTIVQFVRFRADDRCLADPSLFQAVRDIAQGWQEKGLNAQYWGTSLAQPKDFFWLLFWQSHAHAIAIKADPSYAIFVQAREALASAPVFEAHVPFSGNPRCALEVPVTEMSFYKTDDRAVNPDARPAAETHELVRYLTGRIQSMQVQGFVALSWGIAFEDATRGFYLGGWTSVEEHMSFGSSDEEKVFIEELEVAFKSFVDLYIGHVHFKPHNLQSSTSA